MKLELIIEKAGGGDISGRIVDKGLFMPCTIASDIKGVKRNIKDLIADYLDHGGDEDAFWKKVNVKDLEFDLRYDLSYIFRENQYFNYEGLANELKFDKATFLKFANQTAYPTKEQAMQIQKGVRKIGKKLVNFEFR